VEILYVAFGQEILQRDELKVSGLKCRSRRPLRIATGVDLLFELSHGSLGAVIPTGLIVVRKAHEVSQQYDGPQNGKVDAQKTG